MKKNLLFAITLCAFLAVPTMAAVTVEEITDPEYLINQGFSEITAEDIFVSKNRVTGKTVEPLYDKSQNRFVNACRKFFAYIDPAMDDQDQRLHHNISPSTSFSDL